ncbi:helix-turn-helix domain-containing protein [Acidovorax sp. SUPP2522]|uniref:STY4528 family pathogenicity island replication protein n=1 Tax=unclassified Acidovorax TaxID=2684926 RepID=UPI00234B407F|nr:MULTISPECIES: STY4528 family pathogenicity island replication protein [unclassified Acidovorax]WCM96057.1 STY4528 family pathogenicity island replication protein [Acidovorax sp. GBBC 1281]GKT20002.1 helix-turn-helix domain-containing protein [Acidovorax sp. SUPP2522]
MTNQEPSKAVTIASGDVSTQLPLLPVPLALLRDRRVMPLERNAWMILHAGADPNGCVSGVTYAELQQFLSCVPDRELASRETVSRCLTILRLTRWIHIDAHIRNPLTGRVRVNHYVVHTRPLSFAEVLGRDLTWIGLLDHALDHPTTTVRQIAEQALRDLAGHPEDLARLPQHLIAHAGALRQQDDGRENGGDDDDEDPQGGCGDCGGDDSELAVLDRPPGQEPPRDNPQSRSHGRLAHTLARTVRKNINKNNTYVPCPNGVPNRADGGGLDLPASFGALAADQQRDVLRQLRRVAPDRQQEVLDEWSARCLLGKVLRPVGYLFALIGRAIKGEFRLFAAKPRASAACADKPACASAAPIGTAARPDAAPPRPMPVVPASSPVANRRQAPQVTPAVREAARAWRAKIRANLGLPDTGLPQQLACAPIPAMGWSGA